MRLVNPYKSKLSLPVYYDLEHAGIEKFAVENGKIFIQRMEENKYNVGIYSNEYWFNTFLKNNFNDYSLWVAKYGKNDGNKHDSPNISGKIDIWQYTDVGKINGISGNVDLNACYIKLPNINNENNNEIINKNIDENEKVFEDKQNEEKEKINKLDDIKNKSVDELANEVIEGKYGNGIERKNALGDRYSEVQKRVNELINNQKKSVDELAREVIEGKYGNGEKRKKALGERYSEVQKRVNELMSSK